MSDDDLIRRGDALYAIAGWEIPSTAIAALPAVTVGVRPLEWEPSVIGKPWHSAKAPWGWYYAQWDDETQAWFASLEMGEIEAPIILSPSDVPTLEAAKAAAQAHFDAAIRGEVILTPATDAAALSATEIDDSKTLDPVGYAAAIREAALREARQRVNDLVAERQADLHGARNDFNRGAVDALQEACSVILALIPKGGA